MIDTKLDTIPFFTIVMASTLRSYTSAAKGRNFKLIRAVESVINQTFQQWELWVISDQCDYTFETMQQLYLPDERINCSMIPHSAVWSGHPRNRGIANAKGQYVLYLDNDDVYGKNHLQIIHDELQRLSMPGYVWYNDRIPNTDRKNISWQERSIKDSGVFLQDGRPNPGTSNLCHRRDVNVWWDVPQPDQKVKPGYDHDYKFSQALKHYCLKNGLPIHKIKTPDYRVCHLHKLFDI